ncbi:protein phosphatase 2C [Bacillus wiedmannii]|uniref:protein phosphatase 2C n=1 Tax=Bacillus wiedmannii TaxID=1890302 RepID=UPI000BF80E7A|nr:protein phosphatase 2C [Bacillus wiedmannii]PEN45033.1 protein phosphatase 2C [Bacillus wiedmannii]
MEKMFKKIKKFMIVAAAAVTLSVGFTTLAPKEASAHWADAQITWALQNKIITVDMRDSLASRQEMWLMMMRQEWKYDSSYNYDSARDFVIIHGYSDGSRGANWVTRSEAAAMTLSFAGYKSYWDPKFGFEQSDRQAKRMGIFDGTRGNEFATRAEVIAMLYNSRYI